MTMSRIAASLMAAPLVVALFATASVALEAPTPGRPAPDFATADSAGEPVTLSAFKGKTVVLEWTNHDCPYVRKHYTTGTMQKLQADAAAKGVVWLTVISSAPGTQGHLKGLEADKLTADRKAAPTAVLIDEAGTVGRLYGATTTPHMFIVDAKGTLVYRGGIDDQPSTNPETVKTARPFVREALDALAKGEPVKTASTRPYGCSVKYTN